MNAVEIEEAISQLAEAPFDSEAFPFAFLEAFGNKPTTIKKLRSDRSSSNKSDIGGVLQRNNIHIKVCSEGEVSATLTALRDSLATAKQKAKFILATDGKGFEAENLVDGETIACGYPDFHNYFGFFLPLAGITTVKQIRENAFDIKATSRLNRLYIELLKENPDWDKAERREALNHFMARLIFCFFAEDTNIFHGDGLFTTTVARMSSSDSSNTHEIISELFQSMSTPPEARKAAKLRNWANEFPYVNGGLFSGDVEVPQFSKIARSYLLHVGNLDWTKINPDIFGSMIQAVADDEERGALGMHYTSVPNILKVLNPLFLDDLRSQLETSEDNVRKLLNLRQRMTRIRVFDPACGSGNFLVIAYKEMRVIEDEVNRRRGEAGRRSDIPLTNFRGIELRHFSAEIARLALVIAKFQCDVLYLGQQEAMLIFLPLERDNWITCGNALRLDWLSICPPTGTGVKLVEDDLFSTPLEQAEIDFENEGGETYICGNPPYKGGTEQSKDQKADMNSLFSDLSRSWKSLDYVCGWFIKFAQYSRHTHSSASFVSTNSICQGEQVARLWPLLLEDGLKINFAHTSFRWSNLAKNDAGVTVIVIGLKKSIGGKAKLFELDDNDNPLVREVDNINPYLVNYRNLVVQASTNPISDVPHLINGSKPVDGKNLSLNAGDAQAIIDDYGVVENLIRPYFGSDEFIKGKIRYCLWISDSELEHASKVPEIKSRLAAVAEMRSKSTKPLTKAGVQTPHYFQQIRQTGKEIVQIVPSVSSESRHYLPVGLLPKRSIISNLVYGFLSQPTWCLSLVASRIHLVWIAAICGKLKTDYRYSSTLGWNTFPIPVLTEQNRADLTRCAENILLAREAHFPATIADLYNPQNMPTNLREAHDCNDEAIERIYIGRRFKNDTERLEKLFELYTKMTT